MTYSNECEDSGIASGVEIEGKAKETDQTSSLSTARWNFVESLTNKTPLSEPYSNQLNQHLCASVLISQEML